MTPVEDWEPRTLTDLADYVNGFAFKSDDWGSDGLPIIRIEQLRNPGAPTDYFKGKLSATQMIDDGDLVFSWSASLFLRIWQSGRAALNQHLFKVTERDGVDRAFLKAIIEFNLPKLTAASHGSTMQHITRTELRRFATLVPIAKVEQTAIAQVLTTLDQVIEEAEALIGKQQRINTGLMQVLLTCGVDHDGRLRSKETHTFKDSVLGRIPEEWETATLGSKADLVTSGSRGWAKFYSDDGAVFLRIGNLTRDHINLRLSDIIRVMPPQSSEGSRTSLKAGDLLISITADLGIIGVVPANFEEAYINQHIALVRLRQGSVDSRFLGWFLNGRGGQSQFETLNESGAKAGLNLPTVKRLSIPMPHPAEQKTIANILDAATQQLNRYREQLSKLTYFKNALMQELLTGKRRVTTLLNTNMSREAKI